MPHQSRVICESQHATTTGMNGIYLSFWVMAKTKTSSLMPTSHGTNTSPDSFAPNNNKNNYGGPRGQNDRSGPLVPLHAGLRSPHASWRPAIPHSRSESTEPSAFGRWPGYSGGDLARMAILHRRPYCTGGHIAQAAILHRQPHRTGGHTATLSDYLRGRRTHPRGLWLCPTPAVLLRHRAPLSRTRLTSSVPI